MPERVILEAYSEIHYFFFMVSKAFGFLELSLLIHKTIVKGNDTVFLLFQGTKEGKIFP